MRSAMTLSRGPICRTVTVSSLAAAQATVPSTHAANMMAMPFSALNFLTELDDNVSMMRTLHGMTLPLARSARTTPSTDLTHIAKCLSMSMRRFGYAARRNGEAVRRAKTHPAADEAGPMTAQLGSRLRAHATTGMGGKTTPYMATGS
jgi:hypothetical protein